MPAAPTASTDETEARKSWMSLLAKAPPARLAALFDAQGDRPAFGWLRRPEIGSVMVQGCMGGTGAALNLGEMTVTRCALRLEDGTEGHAYVQGRDKAHAEAAALMDALMQTGRAAALEPLEREMTAETRVDFFTMVRGED